MKIPLLLKYKKVHFIPRTFYFTDTRNEKILSITFHKLYLIFYMWMCFFMCVYICWCICACVEVGQGLILGFIPLVPYIKLFFHSTFIYLLQRSRRTCHNMFLEVRGQSSPIILVRELECRSSGLAPRHFPHRHLIHPAACL